VYKVAIIGLGQIGYKIDNDPFRSCIWSHAKAYQKHPNCTLIAVSDLDQNNYKDFNKIYPKINFYKNYIQLLKKEEIEILSICTPTSTHLKIVENLFHSKSLKSIFIEKPMGQDLNEAIKISKICKKNNISLAINYMRKWETKYISIKKIIKKKTLGNLQTISAYGCTALLTSASHLIDLFLYYGGTIDWLVGSIQTDFIRKIDNKISDHGGIAFVKFKNGSFGLLKGISKHQYNYMFELDLLFSIGRIKIFNDGKNIEFYKFSSSKKTSGKEYKTLEQFNINNIDLSDNERMLDAITNIIDNIENKIVLKSNEINSIHNHRFIKLIKLSNSISNKKIIYNEQI